MEEVLSKRSKNLFALEVDDASELFGIEGGTSDKASVDLGHGHEFINTVRCHGSTVLDSGGLCDFVVVHAGQDGSDEGMGVVFVSFRVMVPGTKLSKVKQILKFKKKGKRCQKFVGCCNIERQTVEKHARV